MKIFKFIILSIILLGYSCDESSGYPPGDPISQAEAGVNARLNPNIIETPETE